MTTSARDSAQSLQREIHNFYWGVWSELGVSGWGRTHHNWAIDPEPLIVFSPSVITSQPRLRDEVIDWCSDNWRHVSAVRLRHILNENPEEDTDAWGQLAATVNRSSGSTHWPRATKERDFVKTGRSTLRPLTEDSMIYLRMRSIFGLTARTEILRYLLFTGEPSTAAMLAMQVNYAKRNVAEACESLSRLASFNRSRWATGCTSLWSIAKGSLPSSDLAPRSGPIGHRCCAWSTRSSGGPEMKSQTRESSPSRLMEPSVRSLRISSPCE